MSTKCPCYVCGDEVQMHPESDDFGICSGCGAENHNADLAREEAAREEAENPQHGDAVSGQIGRHLRPDEVPVGQPLPAGATMEWTDGDGDSWVRPVSGVVLAQEDEDGIPLTRVRLNSGRVVRLTGDYEVFDAPDDTESGQEERRDAGA
ncbi:hypothetical protein [Patulibacter sp. SYSU D01012]|uniref:hypothetical protein n=1 Tax=Patulibacter sp. SYSU D01012 TaxID=2817381 RepID=UPI001B310AAF|nr:hypothetical protein [Patulibacter sp. SYSU D01012]